MQKLAFCLILASAALFFCTSCEKNDMATEELSTADALKEIDSVMGRDSEDFEKNITSDIVYIDDCDCPVSGVVELIKDGVVEVIIDFGDGTCDKLAEKIVDGAAYTFEMDCDKAKEEGKEEEYEKVITNEIVKLDDCDCPVSGTIQFWKEDLLVATIDYGDGTCDNLATKTTDEGVYEYELEDCE